MRYQVLQDGMSYQMSKLEEIIYYFEMSDDREMRVPLRETYASVNSMRSSIYTAVKRLRLTRSMKVRARGNQVYLVKCA